MFNLCATGKSVLNDAQKQALLLHVASKDFQQIYSTRADDGRGVSFEATLHMLDNNYFVSNLNIPFDRHFFRQKN